jgi:hypothetical protein
MTERIKEEPDFERGGMGRFHMTPSSQHITIKRNQTLCNNCGKQGHSFNHCKSPIVSYGIIAFRQNPLNSSPEYLMIRRKDTLGFIDFMRGKYSVYNKEYVLNMIKQMTNAEKYRIKTESFSTLWRDLWGPMASNLEQYKSEETNSRNKFELLRGGVYTRTDSYTLEDLVNLTPLEWDEPEWGFPKGRRNYQERDCDCAVREFCEETGYRHSQLILLKNVAPFEEIKLLNKNLRKNYFNHIFSNEFS